MPTGRYESIDAAKRGRMPWVGSLEDIVSRRQWEVVDCSDPNELFGLDGVRS